MIRSAGSPSRLFSSTALCRRRRRTVPSGPESVRRMNRSLTLSSPAHHLRPRGRAGLLRSHAYGAIEADGLAVEHRQLENILHQLCKFLRPAESLRKWLLLAQGILDVLRNLLDHRRLEGTGRNGYAAAAESRKFPRNRQGHAGDGGLGRGVGRLTDLPLESSDRRGMDDEPPLAVRHRNIVLHKGDRSLVAQEGAEQG